MWDKAVSERATLRWANGADEWARSVIRTVRARLRGSGALGWLTRGGAGPRWSWGAGVGRCWAKKRKKAGLGWVGGVGLLDHVLG